MCHHRSGLEPEPTQNATKRPVRIPCLLVEDIPLQHRVDHKRINRYPQIFHINLGPVVHARVGRRVTRPFAERISTPRLRPSATRIFASPLQMASPVSSMKAVSDWSERGSQVSSYLAATSTTDRAAAGNSGHSDGSHTSVVKDWCRSAAAAPFLLNGLSRWRKNAEAAANMPRDWTCSHIAKPVADLSLSLKGTQGARSETLNCAEVRASPKAKRQIDKIGGLEIYSAISTFGWEPKIHHLC